MAKRNFVAVTLRQMRPSLLAECPRGASALRHRLGQLRIHSVYDSAAGLVASRANRFPPAAGLFTTGNVRSSRRCFAVLADKSETPPSREKRLRSPIQSRPTTSSPLRWIGQKWPAA